MTALGAYSAQQIEGAGPADDPAAIAETLHARLGGGGARPDCLLIDGGKAQLSAACGVLRELGLEGEVAVLALAKREEELRRLRGEKARALADAADRIARLESNADEAREAVEDARASAERREREAEAAQRVWATLEATLREQIEAYELERRRREEEGDLDGAEGVRVGPRSRARVGKGEGLVLVARGGHVRQSAAGAGRRRAGRAGRRRGHAPHPRRCQG